MCIRDSPPPSPQSKDGLDKMCQGQIKLFLSGSAAWMKRSLVKVPSYTLSGSTLAYMLGHTAA
eukprot:2608040-Rhodomonas_salina.1